MSKRQLLLGIWYGNSELSIENLFGEAAWALFAELQPNDDIVVVGNGPVSSRAYGAHIDSAKLVIRCNNYKQFTNSALGRKKIGGKACTSRCKRPQCSCCAASSMRWEQTPGVPGTPGRSRQSPARNQLSRWDWGAGQRQQTSSGALARRKTGASANIWRVMSVLLQEPAPHSGAGLLTPSRARTGPPKRG